jgi:hypothetical protein
MYVTHNATGNTTTTPFLVPTVHMSDFGSWHRQQLRILVLINRVMARIWISCQLQELSVVWVSCVHFESFMQALHKFKSLELWAGGHCSLLPFLSNDVPSSPLSRQAQEWPIPGTWYLRRKLRMVAYWINQQVTSFAKLFPSQFQGWRAETLVHPHVRILGWVGNKLFACRARGVRLI